MNMRFARVVTATLTAAALAAALAGCNGGDDRSSGEAGPGSPGSPGSSGSAGSQAVVTVTTVDTLTGQLDQTAQEQLAGAVTSVVDDWFEGAYLGDFPRADFTTAFAGFTPGAAKLARKQVALMTNAVVSDQIEAAEAVSRSVSLDVLAVEQKAAGVTATVDLVFTTSGGSGQTAEGSTEGSTEEVTGTLDLTPAGSGWKVFGFDITRAPLATGGAR